MNITQAQPKSLAEHATRSDGRFVAALRDHGGWMLAIFLIGLAVKLFLILQSGGALPYSDQWEGEAADLYIPYFEHQLSIGDLFHPHNEHRIFFTHVYDLALLILNHQWDSQLQMVGNAVFHCATVAGFGWLMATFLGTRIWPVLFAPLTLVLVLPFAWQNTVWGFQSQFYFLLFFSLLTIWLLGSSEPWSSRWRLGVFTAIFSLFTMASGFMAALAVAAVVLLDILKRRQSWRQQLPTLSVCAVLTVAGLLLKAKSLDPYVTQAHSLRDFIIALGRNLAWPCIFQPWLAPLNLFPLIALGWMCLNSKDEITPGERMTLGIGFWVGLQIAATAFARGVGGQPPAYRYMDTLSFLVIANLLSIILLFMSHRQRFRFAPFWYVGFVAWALACSFGFWKLTNNVLKIAIPSWTVRQDLRVANTRAFITTDDEGVFRQDDSDNIPFPFVPELVFLLREQDIRAHLPACVREPLKVTPQAGGREAFLPSGYSLAQADPPTERSWGSYSGTARSQHGTFESLPVKKSALPYLEISVAGDLGQPGLSLEVVDLANGKTNAVRAPHGSRAGWACAYIKAPAGDFKMVARDESDANWFAFKEPREMGRLSYWSVKVLAAWKVFLFLGLGCIVVNFALLFQGRSRTQ